MAFVEDPTLFYGDFAVAATLAAAAIPSGVIFDNAYREALDGHVVEGTMPTVLAVASEIPSVEHGQSLVVNATTYTVRGIEPDGVGMVRLMLEAA